MIIKKLIFVLMAFFLVFVVYAGEARASSASVSWFSAVPKSMPDAIVPGVDDSVWFSMDLVPEIGHMDAQGNIHYYWIGKPVSALARDKAGNVWFATSGGGVGYTDANGNVRQSYTGNAYNLTYSQGKIWFLTGAHEYGSISTNEGVTLYTLPEDFSAYRMAPGSDGNLWITDNIHSIIGKVHPSSSLVIAYPLPENSRPDVITSNPDGALWFIENKGIGRITTTGTIKKFNVDANNLGGHGNITSGPENTLWFVADNHIYRMTTAGKVTKMADLTGKTGSGNITRTSKGFMWFTDMGGDRVGRIS